MAEIQLHNVSLDYSTPAGEPASRIFQIRRERNMEDLPVEIGKHVLALYPVVYRDFQINGVEHWLLEKFPQIPGLCQPR